MLSSPLIQFASDDFFEKLGLRIYYYWLIIGNVLSAWLGNTLVFICPEEKEF